MTKKIISILLCALMVFASLGGTLAEGMRNPIGKSLSAIFAYYMAEGGEPNENERLVYETIHNHKVTLICLWEAGNDDSTSFLQTIQEVYERFSEISEVLVVGCCWNASSYSNSEIWQVLQDNGCSFRSVFLDNALSEAVGDSIHTPSVLMVGNDCIIQDYIYGQDANYTNFVSRIYDFIGRPHGFFGTNNGNIEWTFYPETGLLAIIGYGSMGNQTYDSVPWTRYRDQITDVYMSDEIEIICNWAFTDCVNLHSITLPANLMWILNNSFYNCPIDFVIIPPFVDSIERYAFSNVSLAVFLGAPPDLYDNNMFDDNCIIYYPNANVDYWAPNGETAWFGYTIKPFPIITFVDMIDNSVLSEQEIFPRESAVAPEAPEHYGYTFAGWSCDFDNVLDSMTVYAVYEPVLYTITFTDGLGNVISEQQVPYLSPAAEPDIPEREGYTFTGWDSDFSCIAADLIVNATWSLNYYTVTFYDPVADEPISVQLIAHGSPAEAPEAPEHYGYTFTGWSCDFDNIIGDLTVNAVYEPVLFTVTFTDGYGNILSEQQVPYLSAATAPNDPTHLGYTFTGWDADFSCIEADLTVNATWSINHYNITFYDTLAGEVIEIQSVAYGTSAIAPEAPEHYGYVFTGWSSPFVYVTGDATIYTIYERDLFTVTFTDGFGNILSEQQIEYQSAAQAPADPEHEGYTFAGWDTDFSCVESDLTVNAVWNINYYTVVFYDPIAGAAISFQSVPYGSAAEAPEAPEHEGFTFTGWDSEFDCITSDIVINAVYLRDIIRGDADGNGVVTSADALLVLRVVMGLIEPTPEMIIACDLDGDGSLSTNEALLILRYAAELIEEL